MILKIVKKLQINKIVKVNKINMKMKKRILF